MTTKYVIEMDHPDIDGVETVTFVVAEVSQASTLGVVSFGAVAAALATADVDVSLNGQRFIDLDDPGDPQDAATKAYVDAAIDGVVLGAGEYKGALVAQDNSGVSAYPSSADFAIARSATFITSAVQNGDSVRFFAAGTAGLFGRCKNDTAFFIDLYPLALGSINANGTELAADTPLELAPGLMFDWMIDSAGVFHVKF